MLNNKSFENHCMKEQDSKEWIWPPPEHWVAVWGMVVIAITGIIAVQLVSWFHTLTPAAWIRCYGAAVLFGAVGVGLLFYAKLPLYRERRFFTFGARALPEERRVFYRWSYRCAIVSATLFGSLWLWARG